MQMRNLKFETGVDTSNPLRTLYHSHDTIVAQIRELAALPELAAQADRARAVARAALALFEGAVLDHHAEEERDLFPAAIRSATPGPEREFVESMAARLTAEHRAMEKAWKHLEPAVRAAAKGRSAPIDAGRVAELVQAYTGHAQFEEQEFLPLAQAILQRNANHLGALGVALHVGRTPDLSGYL
jgi:hemerythrin-like domain-containing protein